MLLKDFLPNLREAVDDEREEQLRRKRLWCKQPDPDKVVAQEDAREDLDETMEVQPAANETQKEILQGEITVYRSGDGFSRRPDHIPAPGWKQGKQFHRPLGHPSSATLVELLQR